MMTARPRQLASRFTELRKDTRVGGIAVQGLEKLYALFGGPATPGVDMTVRALSGDVPESRIRALAPTFIEGPE
ncbi:hypothetical protein ACFUNF_41965 [Streptomyces sp. NPDC057291]|uniref:hypothetical protein n=1 Tax=Streptomyces sp. NPDC057291 TaxID=3346087 RepID=UPI003643A550